MRLVPCDEPFCSPNVIGSNPKASARRSSSADSAALPMIPIPTTATSQHGIEAVFITPRLLLHVRSVCSAPATSTWSTRARCDQPSSVDSVYLGVDAQLQLHWHSF